MDIEETGDDRDFGVWGRVCGDEVRDGITQGTTIQALMMGVPINGPSLVYGDNMSVIYNTQSPESTMKKKCNSVAYHACIESLAMGEESLTAGHVSATKCLFGKKRRDIVSRLLFNIYDDEELG